MEAIPWLFVVLGGPLLLAGALLWGKLRSDKRNREIDPNRSADDPARGSPPSGR